MKKKTILIVFLTIFILIILSGITYYILRQHAKMNELVEQFDLQKEDLEDEYAQLAIQYEGYQLNVTNDSLLDQLDSERVKVQRLLEELHSVKSTNQSRIRELQNELNSLRNVLRNFVIQIDSLNALNTRLTKENKEVTRRYEEVTQTATKLREEKKNLSEQVVLASKLDAMAFNISGLDRRRRESDRISRIEQLKICFTLGKNITAPIGEKWIYMRIIKPDNEPLIKTKKNTFTYEGSEIEFSSSKLIEYDGNEQAICIYWDVEEFLFPGTYRVDIFADGYLIGKKAFDLKK